MQHSSAFYLLYAYCITLILIISCAYALQLFIPADIPAPTHIKALFILKGSLFPETKERTVFISLIILLLPINLIAIQFVTWLKTKQITLLENFTLQIIVIGLIPLVLLLLIYWDVLSLITGAIQGYWLMACFTTLLAVSVFYSAFIQPQRLYLNRTTQRLINYALVILLNTVILISVLSFRIQSVQLVDEKAKWVESFEAVFYSLSQTVAGKTLLADLPAQYGLYAEILSPLFRVIGLSVISFTAIMSALQIFSLYALLWICGHFIKQNIIKLFCVMSLCLVTGNTWMVRLNDDMVDEYYQYWPLRFLFPAVSLCVFYKLLTRSTSYSRLVVMAGFSGLAITWNIDSGIPVFGALLAYLIMEIVFPIRHSRLVACKKTLCVITTAAIWLVGFGIYLQAKANHLISWQDVIKYQQIFYHSGFAMLPLPTPSLLTLLALDPWLAVIAVYIFAISGALFQRVQQKPSRTWDMLFFMAVLGLGLFVYYQGRSHIFVLTAVVWPAIFIAFILTDRSLRAIKARLLPPLFAATVLPVLLLGVILTAVLMTRLPIFLSHARNNQQRITQPVTTPVTQNIAFISDYAHNNQVVIISKHQAVYFAETGLSSAINGPGIAETILLVDREQFFKQLFNLHRAYLFVQPELLPPAVYRKLLQHYPMKAQSNAGMVFLASVD